MDEITKTYYSKLSKCIRKVVAEREITAQEAALDALGLPLICYSCECNYIQALPPKDTYHIAKRASHRTKKSRTESANNNSNVLSEVTDFVYDAPVDKYVKSTC
jgi:hypothetical protein